ncbi:MAG: GspE/PulE family protein [Candidatus Omnitrophica bacterium]|nr:GspE/PulE family protein [Candidatus Omnitrophota bacterium]
MMRKEIGEVLVEKGIISIEELNKALEEQKGTKQSLGEILAGQGAASEKQVVRALSEELGFAYVELSEITIEPEALAFIPEEVAVKFRLIPLFLIQNTLTVAMAEPQDREVVTQLKGITGKKIKPIFACPSAINAVIDTHYHKTGPSSSKDIGAISKKQAFSYSQESGPANEKIDSLKQAASLAQVVEMVDHIITNAVEIGASDIHLEPQKNKFLQRCRVDGVLSSVTKLPLERESAIISRVKIVANMDIAEKRLPQDGRIRVNISGRNVDLRVSTFPTINGENVVMRILDRSQGVLSLEELGFQEKNLKHFSEIIEKPHGIILVTGPTGSGKTTTLYAALGQINSLEKNIITLEDPVEYEIPNVRQSQVNVKAGLTFASGLRSILRQDPDIIMIGEIRDKDTADIAIRAALTGHLVFSTLHTNDAPSAATRLVDMGVEPFLVSSSVIGILSQRLVRVLCPECRQKYTPQPELLKDLGLEARSGEEYSFYKEAGCSKCNNRGYVGRTGVYELLVPDEEIKNLISKKSSDAAIKEAAKKKGMVTLYQSGLKKVISGITSVSELLRVSETT